MIEPCITYMARDHFVGLNHILRTFWKDEVISLYLYEFMELPKIDPKGMSQY
jgi:hypothetical protein